MNKIKLDSKVTVRPHPDNDCLTRKFIGRIGVVKYIYEHTYFVDFCDSKPPVILSRSETRKPNAWHFISNEIKKLIRRLKNA